MNAAQDLVVESFPARSPSLRVALVTETFPPEINGVAMTLGRLVDGLLTLGHEVQVIRLGATDSASCGPREGLEEVFAKGVPIPSYPDLHFGFPAGARLLGLWKLRRPDVVHVATEGPLGWSAVTAARKLRIPVTSSFHTNFDHYSSHYGIGLLRSPIDAYLRKLHNRTLVTMVPTEAMQGVLGARGYKNVQVLPRGVAIELFRPECRSHGLRASWGVAPDDVVVLHVGRLAKEKNIGTVLTAFNAVQKRLPSAKLVVVGDGPLGKVLRETCTGAVFCGARTGADLAAHYASGDLFLFPSVTETYGNVVPEAMASGLAVLSYARAAAANLIRNGHNGALVPVSDEFAFVKAAVELACQPSTLQMLRLNAPLRVQHLGWRAVVDTFVTHLRQAIDGGGQSFSVRTHAGVREHQSQPIA